MDKGRFTAALYVIYVTMCLVIGGATLVSVLPLMTYVILANTLEVWAIWLFFSAVSIAMLVSSVWLITGAFFDNLVLKRKLDALKGDD